MQQDNSACIFIEDKRWNTSRMSAQELLRTAMNAELPAYATTWHGIDLYPVIDTYRRDLGRSGRANYEQLAELISAALITLKEIKPLRHIFVIYDMGLQTCTTSDDEELARAYLATCRHFSGLAMGEPGDDSTRVNIGISIIFECIFNILNKNRPHALHAVSASSWRNRLEQLNEFIRPDFYVVSSEFVGDIQKTRFGDKRLLEIVLSTWATVDRFKQRVAREIILPKLLSSIGNTSTTLASYREELFSSGFISLDMHPDDLAKHKVLVPTLVELASDNVDEWKLLFLARESGEEFATAENFANFLRKVAPKVASITDADAQDSFYLKSPVMPFLMCLADWLLKCDDQSIDVELGKNVLKVIFTSNVDCLHDMARQCREPGTALQRRASAALARFTANSWRYCFPMFRIHGFKTLVAVDADHKNVLNISCVSY